MGDMDITKILSHKSNNLFQSDAWADFQAGLKRKSWVVKGDNIQGLILKYPLLKQNLFSRIDSRLRSSSLSDEDGSSESNDGNDRGKKIIDLSG